MRYPALVEREAGVVGVVFPDLPGCVAAAATIDEALVDAEAVLRDWIDVAEEDGRRVPPPSALEDVCVPAGSVLVSIPLVRPSGVPVRANPLPRFGRGGLHRQRAQAARHDPPSIRGVDGSAHRPDGRVGAAPLTLSLSKGVSGGWRCGCRGGLLVHRQSPRPLTEVAGVAYCGTLHPCPPRRQGARLPQGSLSFFLGWRGAFPPLLGERPTPSGG